MSFTAFVNESATSGGGAGIQSAQLVVSKGAKAVITGNCGPNAIKTLSAAGVKVFLRVTGSNESPCSKLQGIKADFISSPHPNPLPKEKEHNGMTL